MRLLVCFLLATALGTPCFTQVLQLSRERLTQLTAKNPYGRFDGGRPKVPDALLERVKALSVEEAWGVMRDKGYHNQFAEDLQPLHPGRKLVGRAMTAQYLPDRPDMSEFIKTETEAMGVANRNTQRVVDALQLGDVPVVSLMGATKGHNFGGDNMHAAVYGITKTGAVVDGTVRDIEGIFPLPTQIYFKKPHPAAVSGVSVVGLNIPVHISGAIVMPGDVVLGDRTGVIFIPPHLVEEIVEKSETVRFTDEWRKAKFLTGNYQASDLYHVRPLTADLQKDLDDYVARRRAETKPQ
jgi:4-hydroxy-4-methyl-2-oxoglutarate aldolase